MSRKRADLLLVERGLFESRAKARAAIEAGRVAAGGRVVARPSDLLDEAAEIAAQPAHPWVGRGGLKLDHAMTLWPVEVAGRVALDVGASTGGFTPVCLSRGAARVYAVDVGREQLHASLRADPRVVDVSGIDARVLDRSLVPEPVGLIVSDVSFIGLAKALPAALGLAEPGADLIVLVKPQFEAGPKHVAKGGMVRDAAVRERTVDAVAVWLESVGWRVRGRAESPILGGEGAVEYLVWARRA